ncbi:tyrosine-type recombinase/integrase [Hymenobacter fodinae]|uniref:Tyr recombinase domain-containing protein n=1 Tax=Hymenobacter fodinae TaxID=2510796 RepID=A0A4Z0P319_9BACT|nr:tyrosine-type recombinase/integrase [Hymenobacter fodinae]TGE06093.1 hypothetical protein EU556_14595 [Hymenobacter fodinae]
MSKLSYLLRTNKSGLVTISIKHTHHQHIDKVPFVKAANVVVFPNQFDKDKGKVLGRPDATELNKKIQVLENNINLALELCRSRGVEPFKAALEEAYTSVVAFEQARAESSRLLKETAPRLVLTLHQQLEEAQKLVAELKQRIEIQEAFAGNIQPQKLFTAYVKLFIGKHKNTLRQRSQDNYTNVLNAVKEWNPRLRIDEITVETLEAFRDFLLTEKKQRVKDKEGEFVVGLRNGTVRELIQKFKSVYYFYAEQAGVDDSKIRKWKHGVKRKQNRKVVFLNSDELNLIKGLTCLTEREKLHRDFYVFMANTGLRFVDARRVTEAHINDDKIVIVQQKVSEEVTIPLTADALALLQDYKFDFSEVKYTAQVSYYMKRILERHDLLGQPHVRTHFKQNQAKEEIKPKRDLLGAHTARKTFINIALEKGTKITSIKNIVGHAELKMILDVYGDGTMNEKELGKAFIMPHKAIEANLDMKAVA